MSTATADRELVFTRLIDAPRALVYRAFTEPAHIMKWWGPNGFTNTHREMNVKPGGVWRYIMHGPDGVDYPNKIVYTEIVENERLVYEHSDDQENTPPAFHVTITFEDKADKTRLTMRMLFPTAAAKEQVVREFGATEGANQTLGRLEDYVVEMEKRGPSHMSLTVPSEREIVMQRTFDAPAKLVWEAWTRPEHVRRWWGCGAMTMTVCDIDLKPRGAWRYVLRMPDGTEHPFKGVYREIEPPRRLVYTQVYDVPPMSEHEALVTVTFVEQNGRTTMAETILHDSMESRNGHFASGMDQGAEESLNNLANLLAELR